MITFTGSTEVGRAFLRYSADSNLKGIVLECGGKSPQIVMADCRDELDTVAADLAEAAFWNAAQTAAPDPGSCQNLTGFVFQAGHAS